jgi:hypothetical protein
MSEDDERSTTSSEATDTPSEAGSDPTPDERQESIDTVTQWVDNFHLSSDMAPPSEIGTSNGSPGTKVNPPIEFTGRRDQIKPFRLQCKLYWEMNPDKFKNKTRNKILFAVSYLRGKAQEWVQPHLEDYLDAADAASMKESTKAVLGLESAFFAAIEETFACGSDVLEAERDLRALRQKTSAAQYRAEFQILASKVGWNDDALASQFYRGLKDKVREEITMREDERPRELKEIADLAVKIDTKLFELQLEKKGRYTQGHANTKAKRDVPEWRDNYYGLQKMQIDATKGKPGSKGQGKGQQKKPKDKSQVECYGCGKKGHFKNECRARKQSHELPRSGRQESFRATKGSGKTQEREPETPNTATMAATNNNWTYEDTLEGRGAYDTTSLQDDHGLMSWTACYDDSCAIHLSDKQGSGYFPSRRRQSICLTRGMPNPTQTAQDALVRYPTPEIEELSLDGSTPEESEEEDSEEDSDATEQVYANFRAGDIVPQLLGRIMLRKDEVFPWIDGQQHVHDNGFTTLINDVRQLLRNTPVVEGSINYRMIVQEWPPVGSDFTARGGYCTPENICIPRSMRIKVQQIKKEYEEEAERQRHERVARIVPLTPRSPRTERGSLYETDQRRQEVHDENPPRIREVTGDSPAWEPPLSTSDPRYVPHRRHVRLGARSGGQNTSGGQNRTNQRSEN